MKNKPVKSCFDCPDAGMDPVTCSHCDILIPKKKTTKSKGGGSVSKAVK